MRMFLRLLGVQLNQRYGLSALRADWRDHRGRFFRQVALWLVMVVSIGSLVWMYTWLLRAMMPAFAALGMESVLLGLVLLLAMLFVFFMGLLYLIGMLFFSKDTEFLAALPIPQGTVFAAKFAQVLLGELVTTLALLLPPFVVFAVSSGSDVGFWLRMLLVALATPCIPLALAGLLSLLLMRFAALWRRRELLTVIGAMVFTVGIMVLSSTMGAMMPEDMTMEMWIELIGDQSGLLTRVVSAFPPAGWAARGLLEGGGMLWLFLGVSAVALGLVTWLASHVYYRGAMAQLETEARGKKVTLQGRSVRRHSPLAALFIREWRTTLRSPVYALNGLITIVMGPLLMLLPLLIQGAASSSGDEFSQLLAMLGSLVDERLILMGLAALFAVISTINTASTTSLSREGRLFYLLRVIPVPPFTQALAKYLFGLSVGLLTMLAMGVTAALALGFSPLLVLQAFLLGMLVSVAPQALSQLPDILRPKLTWGSETEAIKQNLNGMLGMLIGWGYLALLIYGAYLLLRGGMDAGTLLALVAGVSVALGAVSLWGLGRAANHSWRAIEG